MADKFLEALAKSASENQRYSASAPAPAPPDPFASVREGAAGLITGALKGAGSTLNQVGGLVLLPVARGLEAAGIENPTIKALGELPVEPARMKPAGTAEKIGYGLEQGAEYMVPELAGGRALEAAKGVPVMGRISEAVPRLSELAVKSAGGAGLGALQSPEDRLAGAETGGLMSAAGNVMGRIAVKPLGAIGEARAAKAAEEAEIPLRKMRYAMQPTEKSYRYGKTPVEAVMTEQRAGRIPQTDQRADLLSAVKGRMDEAGKEIDALVGSLPEDTKLDASPAIDALDERIGKLDPEINKDLLKQSLDLRHRISARIGNLEEASPKDVQAAKREIDRIANYGSPDQAGFISGLKHTARRRLDSVLDQAVPGHREANQLYSSLASARDDLQRASRREAAGRLEKEIPKGKIRVAGVPERMWRQYEEAHPFGAAAAKRIGKIAPWVAFGYPLERYYFEHMYGGR